MIINLEGAQKIALSMYAGEPCRICGKIIWEQDINDGAVYAGYSADNHSRSAHKHCWENSPEKYLWAYPIDNE